MRNVRGTVDSKQLTMCGAARAMLHALLVVQQRCRGQRLLGIGAALCGVAIIDGIIIPQHGCLFMPCSPVPHRVQLCQSSVMALYE
jgi:hypothetical protein